jgi:hypothetical protein
MLAALRGCRASKPERLNRYLRLFTFSTYDRFDLNIHSVCMFSGVAETAIRFLSGSG